MALARLKSDERPQATYEFVVLSSWTERLRGLLGTGRDARPVLLVRCGSVHTFGMRYPIDLAFVGEQGEVLMVRRGVGPGHVCSCAGAECVAERPAVEEGEWPVEGEHLWIVSVSADAAGA